MVCGKVVLLIREIEMLSSGFQEVGEIAYRWRSGKYLWRRKHLPRILQTVSIPDREDITRGWVTTERPIGSSLRAS